MLKTNLAALILAALCEAMMRPAPAATPPRPAADVDAARLKAADAEPQNWFTGGRDQQGSYYSPLKTINEGNVARLGFAWRFKQCPRRRKNSPA